VGARFDYKARRRESEYDRTDPAPVAVDDDAVLSPRVAVIYSPIDAFDVKLSFSDSFVDSPYWYRYNSFPTYAGATTLKPERNRSLQLTPTVRLLDGQLVNTLNFAFSQLRDGIYRVPDARLGMDPFYNNAGKLDTL